MASYMSGSTLTCETIERYTTHLHYHINNLINDCIIKVYCPDEYYMLYQMYKELTTMKASGDKNYMNFLLKYRSFIYFKFNLFKKAIEIKFNEMSNEQLNTYLLLENPHVTSGIDPNHDINSISDMSLEELDIYLN
jgi:hypothetical protein